MMSRCAHRYGVQIEGVCGRRGTCPRAVHQKPVCDPQVCPPSGWLLEAVGELSDLVKDLLTLTHSTLNLATCMHHSGVIAIAEGLADVGERQLGRVAGDVHGDLSGIDERPATAASGELFDVEPEKL